MKRGAQATVQLYKDTQDELTSYQMPTWGIAALWATAILYFLSMIAVGIPYSREYLRSSTMSLTQSLDSLHLRISCRNTHNR